MKADELYREAVEDIKHGCYNKAASALYFSLRYLAEGFLLKARAPVPKRDDKLANTLDNIGLGEVALALRELYVFRIKADYREENVTKEEAEEALRIYSKARQVLKTHEEKFKV